MKITHKIYKNIVGFLTLKGSLKRLGKILNLKPFAGTVVFATGFLDFRKKIYSELA
ncbi:hypothetical protein [Campylobacter concisus]|uniref:hypothetical protein n=1 Tax=Campylobacter concisus TaxID=199 RepID=UPI0015D70C73|nr:hypothetical protein [Campylobacter concisus]